MDETNGVQMEMQHISAKTKREYKKLEEEDIENLPSSNTSSPSKQQRQQQLQQQAVSTNKKEIESDLPTIPLYKDTFCCGLVISYSLLTIISVGVFIYLTINDLSHLIPASVVAVVIVAIHFIFQEYKNSKSYKDSKVIKYLLQTDFWKSKLDKEASEYTVQRTELEDQLINFMDIKWNQFAILLGQKGNGKTTLLYHMAAQQNTTTIVVEISKCSSPSDVYDEILKKIGCKAHESSSGSLLVSYFRSYYNKTKKYPILIITASRLPDVCGQFIYEALKNLVTGAKCCLGFFDCSSFTAGVATLEDDRAGMIFVGDYTITEADETRNLLGLTNHENEYLNDCRNPLVLSRLKKINNPEARLEYMNKKVEAEEGAWKLFLKQIKNSNEYETWMKLLRALVSTNFDDGVRRSRADFPSDSNDMMKYKIVFLDKNTARFGTRILYRIALTTKNNWDDHNTTQ